MQLNSGRLDGQLERIRKVQAELRRVVLDETLEDLEELLAEKRSRLEGLLLAGHFLGEWRKERAAELRAVLEEDRALVRLIRQKLKLLGTRLKKAHESRYVATQYAIAPARTCAQSLHGTDVTG